MFFQNVFYAHNQAADPEIKKRISYRSLIMAAMLQIGLFSGNPIPGSLSALLLL